ncbi:hypothetical protein KN63_04570 [Smithella sp. F21]|nr:hypothetical protein KN63_04570 [Smithella sp. F21]
MEETRKLAEFLSKTSYKDIPVSVRDHAKLCILDCLGVTIAGAREEMATILVSFAQEMGGKEEATILFLTSISLILKGVNSLAKFSIFNHTTFLNY